MAGDAPVVSHDRYFLERVTDQQYAILDGKLRHLPGGVEEYLRLRTLQSSRSPASSRSLSEPQANRNAALSPGATASAPLAGAERRTAEKELSSIDRRLERLQKDLDALDVQFVEAHDDYARIIELQAKRDAAADEIAALEERWLELSELLD